MQRYAILMHTLYTTASATLLLYPDGSESAHRLIPAVNLTGVTLYNIAVLALRSSHYANILQPRLYITTNYWARNPFCGWMSLCIVQTQTQSTIHNDIHPQKGLSAQ